MLGRVEMHPVERARDDDPAGVEEPHPEPFRHRGVIAREPMRFRRPALEDLLEAPRLQHRRRADQQHLRRALLGARLAVADRQHQLCGRFRDLHRRRLEAVLEMHFKDRGEIRKRRDALIDELHLNHVVNQNGYTLSGGERRRCEIARALVTEPDFILLDEPFAGVDPIAVKDIQELISQLRDRGLGILITDHNVRETLKITDRSYIMYGGTILRSGKPNELIRDPEIRRVYLGEDFRL